MTDCTRYFYTCVVAGGACRRGRRPHISGPDEQQPPIRLMSPRLVPAENSARPPPSGERGRLGAHQKPITSVFVTLSAFSSVFAAKPVPSTRSGMMSCALECKHPRHGARARARAGVHAYRAVCSSRAQRMQWRLSASPLECWPEHGGCGLPHASGCSSFPSRFAWAVNLGASRRISARLG